MKYLLDTNAAIAVLNDHPIAVRIRLERALARGELTAISSIAVFELWCGVAGSRRTGVNAEHLNVFLSHTEILPFEREHAELAADIRVALAKKGKPIGPYDLLIAAHALALDATLITANIAEFSRVPGLRWQDWSKAGR